MDIDALTDALDGPSEAGPVARIPVKKNKRQLITPIVQVRGWILFLGILSGLFAVLFMVIGGLAMLSGDDGAVGVALVMAVPTVIFGWVGYLFASAGTLLQPPGKTKSTSRLRRGAERLAFAFQVVGVLTALMILLMCAAMVWAVAMLSTV